MDIIAAAVLVSAMVVVGLKWVASQPQMQAVPVRVRRRNRR